ncbi:hypothetical protein HYV86_03085 [Candidatus Woesearchaeota archaeon]|nr:hypothetical protein [Candidatus Woesearchaeota archaeon]
MVIVDSSIFSQRPNLNDRVRYYSGIAQVSFCEGYDPKTKTFDKKRVTRTTSTDSTWMHIPLKVVERDSKWVDFGYWFANHVFHYGTTINDAAYTAAEILRWDPTYLPWWPEGKKDEPGDPLVFSGTIEWGKLRNNGLFSTLSIVEVDRLYKVTIPEGSLPRYRTDWVEGSSRNFPRTKIENISHLL